MREDSQTSLSGVSAKNSFASLPGLPPKNNQAWNDLVSLLHANKICDPGILSLVDEISGQMGNSQTDLGAVRVPHSVEDIDKQTILEYQALM